VSARGKQQANQEQTVIPPKEVHQTAKRPSWLGQGRAKARRGERYAADAASVRASPSNPVIDITFRSIVMSMILHLDKVSLLHSTACSRAGASSACLSPSLRTTASLAALSTLLRGTVCVSAPSPSQFLVQYVGRSISFAQPSQRTILLYDPKAQRWLGGATSDRRRGSSSQGKQAVAPLS